MPADSPALRAPAARQGEKPSRTLGGFTLGIVMDDIRKKLDENATLPIWPDVAEMFGLCRGSAYAAAQRGDIKTIRIGRLLKVPTAWLRQKLDLRD